MDNIVVPSNYHVLTDGDLFLVRFTNGTVAHYIYRSGSAGSDMIPVNDIKIKTRNVVMECEGTWHDHMRVKKAMCLSCEYLVVVDGHETRCMADNQHALKVKMKRRAWIGDALLALDVRLGLLATGCSDETLTIKYQDFASNAVQASTYLRYVQEGYLFTFPALGTSTKQLADAFEANYFGTIRDKFVKECFPSLDRATLQALIGDFNAGKFNALFDNLK